VNILGRCCSFALLWVLVCGACAANEAVPQGRSVAFEPACAARDMQALDTIEQFGEGSGVPVAWLRDAGMSWLEARRLCLNGDETAAIALYDLIIAGDVSLSTGLSARLGMK